VYVYRGQFRLGRAAALEHVEAAKEFAQQRNPGGAIREARIALDFDPSNPEALTVLGDALAATGDQAGAQSEYTAALHSSELDPAFQKDLIDQLVTKTRQ
jgi:Flp pilus assembly protein TadD